MRLRRGLDFLVRGLPEAFWDLDGNQLAHTIGLVLMAIFSALGALVGFVITIAVGDRPATGAGHGALIGLGVFGVYWLYICAYGIRRWKRGRRVWLGEPDLEPPVSDPSSNVRLTE